MDVAETQPERQARQFAQLRRLGIVAMSIAEAAGAAAQAELEDPPEQPSGQAKLFLRAAAAVRQIIALELRIEAGPARSSASRAPPVPPKPDPRRPLLQKVLHDAIRNHPDKTARRRQIDADIERELLADPDPAHAKLIAESLHAICTRLDLDLDISRITNEFLDYDDPNKSLSRNRPRAPPPNQ